MNNTISVVIATYNGSATICKQIDSILNQCVKCDEIIICDDCSTDDTVAVVTQKYSDESVHVFVNNVNLGVIKTFENGINKARGNYIFLADQDDYWIETKIQVQLAKMKEMEFLYGIDKPMLVVHDAIIVDGNENVIANSLWELSGASPGNTNLPSTILRNTYTGCMMLLNRPLLNISLPFPELGIYHDHWLGIVAQSYGKIATVEQPLMYYVRHGENATNVISKSHFLIRLIKFPLNLFKSDMLLESITVLEFFDQRYGIRNTKYEFILQKLLNLKSKSVFRRRLMLKLYRLYYYRVFV